MRGISELLAVCAAGALGTGARFLLTNALTRAFPAAFPWGTLAVNLIGSAAAGAILGLGLTSSTLSLTTRIVLTSGFLGGFTTYSAFNTEVLGLLQAGAVSTGLAYAAATVLGGLAAGAAGYALAAAVR